MLARPKIAWCNRLRSLGISPSDLASSDMEWWRGNEHAIQRDMSKIGNRKRAVVYSWFSKPGMFIISSWDYACFAYAASQWEMTLHRNVVSHWLGALTKWPLAIMKWGNGSPQASRDTSNVWCRVRNSENIHRARRTRLLNSVVFSDVYMSFIPN